MNLFCANFTLEFYAKFRKHAVAQPGLFRADVKERADSPLKSEPQMCHPMARTTLPGEAAIGQRMGDAGASRFGTGRLGPENWSGRNVYRKELSGWGCSFF